MKKRILTLIVVLMIYITNTVIFCCFSAAAAPSDLMPDVSEISIGQLLVPEPSSLRSDYLALQLLALNCGYTAEDTRTLYSSAGLNVLSQSHYDKDDTDPSHTCAFTIGEGIVRQNLLFTKKAIVVTIRGTASGEWYSNFDFCPSHSDDAVFSENFLFCAEDVFLTLKDYLDREDDPLVLITGYSRGAACADLLGLLTNEYLGPDRVHVYAFACPAVVKKDADLPSCPNIFNYVNPCDMVPRLPLSQWGFGRIGQDILLKCADENLRDTLDRYSETLYQAAPSIHSYYNDRHSLTGPGLSENGITSFESMLMLCRHLISASPDLLSDNKDIDMDTDADLSAAFDALENSDLYPLAQIGNEMSSDGFVLGRTILHQHLPDIYAELIRILLLEE
ncbi:MAG: lipase family protein [Parasporobacterium sp.]|nr:lipase family protein [Parasporobacterium sp.]